jgi:hypothetical protein
MNLWFVAALILLGSDSFEDRERGEAILLAGLPASMPAVELGVKDADREVSRRCRAIKAVHDERVTAVWVAAAIPKGWVVLPMISKVPIEEVVDTEPYLEMARAEGYVNTGRWGREVERRATEHFLRAWLAKEENRPKLEALMKEAQARETAWHKIAPLTLLPDRPENLPTRAINPEDDIIP